MTLLILVLMATLAFVSDREALITTIPSEMITTLDGEPFNSKSLIKKGKPTLLVFWATCCAPCKKELNTIAEVYKQWQEDTNINIVAVSVDLPQYISKVKPFVKNNKWSYDVYLDVERNLMHAMNVYETPHSFLINKKGEVVWEKKGFSYGDEDIIYSKILEVSKN